MLVGRGMQKKCLLSRPGLEPGTFRGLNMVVRLNLKSVTRLSSISGNEEGGRGGGRGACV